MNERAKVIGDPFLFGRLIGRRQAEEARRRRTAIRSRRATRRMKRRRILQRLTFAGLTAIILAQIFFIGMELGKRNHSDGAGEVTTIAAANEWRHGNG